MRGSSLPGSVLGASGFSSIMWSHIVCWGSRWDFSLSNTFLCLLYLAGIPVAMVFISSGGVKVTSNINFVGCGSLWCFVGSWDKYSLFCVWGPEDDGELGVIHPSSSPIDLWLSGYKPRVSQYCFVFT